MTAYKKRIPQITKERDAESLVICDFCEDEVLESRGGNFEEVELKATCGNVYPESDMRTVEAFDCCGKCWTEKVRPALEALGAKCHEWDNDEGRISSMPYQK